MGPLLCTGLTVISNLTAEKPTFPALEKNVKLCGPLDGAKWSLWHEAMQLLHDKGNGLFFLSLFGPRTKLKTYSISVFYLQKTFKSFNK